MSLQIRLFMVGGGGAGGSLMDSFSGSYCSGGGGAGEPRGVSRLRVGEVAKC